MSIIVLSLINIGLFVVIIGMHIFTHGLYILYLIRDTSSYMTYLGAYSQTFVTYAFCNVDDVSWGTKGATANGPNIFYDSKVFFVSTWYISDYLGCLSTVC